MQDFIVQAEKNGVVLLNQGCCQFCGAEYQNGIFDCMNIYNNEICNLGFNEPNNLIYKFLSVDSHALQHPEIHGRWSNHFHLTRFNLILDKKINWNYKLSPQLSNYLNNYKLTHLNEVLAVPLLGQRGKITSKNIIDKDINDNKKIIYNWATEVYKSWSENNKIIEKIALGFTQTLKIRN